MPSRVFAPSLPFRRLHIFFASLAIFLIFAGAAISLSYRHYQETREQSLKEDRSTANLISLVTEQYIQKVVKTVESYANRPLFIQAVKEKNVEKAKTHLASLIKNDPDIDIMLISDREGTLWATLPEQPAVMGKNLAYRDWYKGVSKEWQPYVSDAILRIVGERDVAFQIAVPVKDAAGNVLGIMASSQRAVGFANILQRLNLDPGTFANVTDRTGNLIYSSRFAYDKQITPFPFYFVKEEALAAKNPTAPIKDPYLEGRTRYLSYAPVAKLDWSVFVGRDSRTILMTGLAYHIETAAIALLLFLLSTGLLIYYRKRVLAQQLLDQLQTEKIIRAGKERFESYVDVTMQLQWMTNDKGEIVEDNPSWSKYTGRGYEEIKGFGWLEDIHPDDRDHTEKIWRNAVAEKILYETEYRVRKNDGVYRDYLARGIPLLAEGGSVREWVGTCIDITDRKKAEEALRKSEESLSITLNSIGDALIAADVEGRIARMNPVAERLTGWQFEDARDKMLGEVFRIVNAETRKPMADPVRLVFERGEVVGLANHTVLLSRDGTEYQIADSAAPIRDRAGITRGVILVFSDVTEKYMAEEKIKASLLEKETMLKEIHHRVKNNLQVISSLLGLQSAFIKDEESRKIFQESQDRVKIMAQIHTMLYQSADLARVDFGGFIRDLISRLQQSYGTAGARMEIHADIADVSLTVETSIPCGLILNELVSNALKHAFPERKKGEINIRMRSEEGRVVLTVCDSGIGFPASIDFRNTQSLGLELVNLLVGQMNGMIDLQVVGGTTWTITFPVKDERMWQNG